MGFILFDFYNLAFLIKNRFKLKLFFVVTNISTGSFNSFRQGHKLYNVPGGNPVDGLVPASSSNSPPVVHYEMVNCGIKKELIRTRQYVKFLPKEFFFFPCTFTKTTLRVRNLFRAKGKRQCPFYGMM